jgi:hypothetical protein
MEIIHETSSLSLTFIPFDPSVKGYKAVFFINDELINELIECMWLDMCHFGSNKCNRKQ